MKRRTFLQSALVVPMIAMSRTQANRPERAHVEAAHPIALGSNPPSLQAVIGGILPRRIFGVKRQIHQSTTETSQALRELASSIWRRYRVNVILYGADGFAVDVQHELERRERFRGDFAHTEQSQKIDAPRFPEPRVYLVHSSAIDSGVARDLASRFRLESLRGISLLVFDEWPSYIDHAEPFRVVDDEPSDSFQPFATSTLSVAQMVQFTFWAFGLRLAISFCVTTAGRMSHHSTPATRAIENVLLRDPNRRVVLRRSDLCVATDEMICKAYKVLRLT